MYQMGQVFRIQLQGIQSSDISESLTGNFTVNSNTATETFNVVDDLTTEGAETFTLTLDGLGEAVNVTINDTSIPAPTYTLSSTGSVDEADSFDVTLTTTNVSDGTNIPYVITGIQAEDILEPLSGNFTVNSNTATKTFNVVDDLTTEGAETFTLTLDIIGTNVSVTVNDTSLTPSGFTPGQLTGSFWWDVSDTATLTESSGKVSSWQDKNQGFHYSEYRFQSTNN